MKQFPRIYSLSTVGLIHHQEFDYHFHPFRTDFIGESGSGKSMIGDLIQLIFVGSNAFESATRSSDRRDPEGMVLQLEGRTKGVGYAFINIEIQPQQYLVVGAYLESGNSHSQGFIIQTGYDWNNIQNLNQPLSFAQLLKDDEILPIDLMIDWLGEQNLHVKSWQRYKEFHKILFRDNLLPIDLASSDVLLKDYAGILQSFSRGKMLDTQKSQSLKEFLFGNEVTKKIWDNFKSAEKELETVVGEYGYNLKEIERATQKLKALRELKELKETRDGDEKIWLDKNLRFCYQEANGRYKILKNRIGEYQKAMLLFNDIIKIIQKRIQSLSDANPDLEKKQQYSTALFNEIQPQYDRVKKVAGWLNELDCTFEQLESRFKSYKKERSSKQILEIFLASLKKQNIEAEFSKLPHLDNTIKFNKNLTTEIQRIEENLGQKMILKKYSNLNDAESLANWALNQKRAFTREEESAILGFQALSRQKPGDLKDYLPNPSELIFALKIVEKEKTGFWIALNGIRRYVEFVEEQILNTHDENQIRSYFDKYTADINLDIAKLELNLANYQKIQDLINSQDNIKEVLTAYINRKEILRFTDIPVLNISEEHFNECMESYRKKETIDKRYKKIKERKQNADEALISNKKVIDDFRDLLSAMGSEPNLTEDQQSLYKKYSSDLSKKQPKVPELTDPKSLLIESRKQWELIRDEFRNIPQWSALKEAVDSSIVNLEAAKRDYLQKFDQEPTKIKSSIELVEPTGESQNFYQSNIRYTSKFDTIIDIYIPSEAFRLKEGKNFAELTKNLLPEAFSDAVLGSSDDSLINAIERYLNQINDKNRKLNDRKIQKIKNLLDEVDESITQQENTIRRIDNFLRSGAQITGGYTARLRKDIATNYPKSWMTTFKEMIDDETQSGSLQSRLSEKINLEEMMKTAFLACNGSLHANMSPAKLLDPSSYYDLAFRMESEKGRLNKGSTGQTYAAVALLCIARLSIISAEEGKAAPPAVRIMPIDEAEGLGANYDMLYDIALKYDYQIISMSIGPVGKFKDGEQNLYMLHKNMEVEEPVNYTPVAVLSKIDQTSSSIEP